MRKKSGLAIYVSKTLKKKRKHPAFQKYTPLRLYTPLSVKKRIITPSNRLTRTPNRTKSSFSSRHVCAVEKNKKKLLIGKTPYHEAN